MDSQILHAFWTEVHTRLRLLQMSADRYRPPIAEADTEVDILLFDLEDVVVSAQKIARLIDEDMRQRDQLESGDLVRDAEGNIVAASWTTYR